MGKKRAGRGMVWALLVLLGSSVCYAQERVESQLAQLLSQNRRVVEEKSLPMHTLRTFYAKRENVPAWKDHQDVAAELIYLLSKADEHGLNPEDYWAETLTERLESRQIDDETELLITAAALRYIEDMKAGRKLRQEVEPDLFPPPQKVDSPALLEEALQKGGEFMHTLSPQAPEYQRLKEYLAELRYRLLRPSAQKHVPQGEVIAPHTSDDRVPSIRERLREEGFYTSQADAGTTYDARLIEAVIRFQRQHGLEADGMIGARTVNEINRTAEQRIRQVLLNMERWRWLPDEMGIRHVRVNIAGFYVKLFDEGEVKGVIRAVVGQPYRRTPVFNSVLTDITLFPHWYVPKSIAVADILPRIQQDPAAFFAASSYIVFRRDEQGKLKVVDDPLSIDWAVLDDEDFPYILRQQAGPENPLGRIRFGVRNDQNIYLHGTPLGYLFDYHSRAFSSGCIRLEEPQTLASFLLPFIPEWEREKVQRAFQEEAFEKDSAPLRRPQFIPLTGEIPVYLLYWTTWVDEYGKIHFTEDIYGRDILLARALGLE